MAAIAKTLEHWGKPYIFEMTNIDDGNLLVHISHYTTKQLQVCSLANSAVYS